MKFVTVRDLRLKPGQVWALAKEEKDIVITANGRPVAILTGVDADTYESELDVIRRARVLKAFDEVHRKSVNAGRTGLLPPKSMRKLRQCEKEFRIEGCARYKRLGFSYSETEKPTGSDSPSDHPGRY